MRRPHLLPEPSFADRASNLLDRIDCRLATTQEDREAIFRLRYQAYLAEGGIGPNPTEMFSDEYDLKDNVWIIGLYLDGVLASSLRFNLSTNGNRDFPSYRVFADLLDPELDAGKVMIDPTRFATDKRLSKLYPALPYVTVRLAWMAAEHLNTDHFLVACRAEHTAFYRRTFNHRLICEPRPYPMLAKPIALMTTNYFEVSDIVHRRYPFFRSTYFERRMLFDKPGQVRLTSSPGVAAG